MKSCGWIDREGIFYPVEYGQHHLFAEKVMSESINPELSLEKLGWVKITKVSNQWAIIFLKPTQAQKNTLWDWCEDSNEKYPL